MYHFVSEQTPELRLSADALVTSHVTQYLKSFQLEAVRFLYDRLAKREFCILNDESGLGKSATVAALLSAIDPAKKTLIALQNDEQLLAGWRFHLDTLTDLQVCTIQGVQDTTDSPHNVYLAKWSQLRSIGDLSRLKFDYVMVDNRGHSLNNSFCTSMLLKHFEGRVNVVISSVDITSDVKLLYNVLRLGGRLEHQYRSFQSFDRRFHIPDPKEVFSKRIDLEEYYKQRGFLSEYIKDFRLRRFRHQFDKSLPLVAPEQYRHNLNLWLASKNSQSTLSGSSEVCSTIASIDNNPALQNETVQSEDTDKLSEHSVDEVVAMSPLVFESSDSDVEPITVEPAADQNQILIVSSDDCEIVTPPNTPPNRTPTSNESPRMKSKKKFSKRKSGQKKADLTDSEEEDAVVEVAPKKITRAATATFTPKTRKLNVRVLRVSMDTLSTPLAETAPAFVTPKTEPSVSRKKKKLQPASPIDIGRPATRGMQRLTRSAESKINSKYLKHRTLDDVKRSTPKRIKAEGNQTPKTSKPRVKQEAKEKLVAKQGKVQKTPVKPTQETPKRKVGRPRKSPSEPEDAKKTKPKPSLKPLPPTPQVLSGSSLSSEYMQCAQRIPDNLDAIVSPAFRVPFTPQQTPLLLTLPSAFNLLNDSEMVAIPLSKEQAETVVINSSHDESSPQDPPQSRRTKALKRKRKPETPVSSSFGGGLGLPPLKRSANKSPDLFSISSEPSQIPLAQPRPSSPFEGFKIFGSEVKQFQQQHAKTNVSAPKKKRDRSCLDILEQMFEPRQQHQEKTSPKVLPTLPLTQKDDVAQPLTQRRRTLLEDDFFEITNNGQFGSRMRLNSSGDVSPVQQDQQSARPTQANKITNYLIGSGITQEKTQPNSGNRNSIVASLRKSPKSPKQQGKSTQATKLTRWFGAVFGGGTSQTSSVESVSAPSTPVTPSTSAAACQTRSARSGGAAGPTKRKRLELFK